MNTAARLKLFLASAVSLSLTITPTGILAAETAAAAPAATLAEPAQPDPWQAELAAWKSASASDASEGYKAYLKAYPAGKFAAIAQTRVKALEAQAAPKVTTSSQAATASDVTPVDASAWQQEYALWQAASAGNTTAEYEAYLSAYPSGKFAAVAQARIVQIAAGTAAPGVSTDDKTAATSPGPVTVPANPQQAQIDVETQVGAFMTDIGTAFTEAQFLDRNGRREIQGRLTSIGYNTHGTDGAFGPRSRSAISAWQQDNGASATAFLSGSQIALIREQSATRYTAWLDEQAAAARAAQPRRKILVVERRVDNRAADAAIALGVMGAMLGVAGGLKHGHHRGRRCAPFAPC